MTPELWAVLPGGIDDPAAPSGGNTYDRRVLRGLSAQRAVHEIRAAGSWPQPGADDEKSLAAELEALPHGATVLLDGLVACAAPGVMEAQQHRLRLVVLVHLPLGDEPGAPAVLTEREGRALRAATEIVATSAGAARRVEGLHDLRAMSVHVALPGVDLAEVTEPEESGKRLLCVAAVTPRKGQDVLADALTELDDLDWTCRCVGAQKNAFAETVRAKNHRIELTGPRTGDALERTYAQADLLVLPSHAETYGMVVTEALARAIPVLGTRVAGVPEAMGSAPDGQVPGDLVEPGDVPALAGALRRWLTDPGLRREWRAAAKSRRGTLRGWDETTRQLSEVLR